MKDEERLFTKGNKSCSRDVAHEQAFLQKMRDVLEEYVLKHMDSHWNP